MDSTYLQSMFILFLNIVQYILTCGLIVFSGLFNPWLQYFRRESEPIQLWFTTLLL